MTENEFNTLVSESLDKVEWEDWEQWAELSMQEFGKFLMDSYTTKIEAEPYQMLQAKVSELMKYNSSLCYKSNGYVIENARLSEKVAEQSAEIERLKTVPMKYRRMAFNAQLQDENAKQAALIERLIKENTND